MQYIFTILTILFLPILSFKEMKPKFCVNCKYFLTDNDSGKYGKCALFPRRDDNNFWLVSGIHYIEEYKYCFAIRTNKDECGPEGKMYKKKYKKGIQQKRQN